MALIPCAVFALRIKVRTLFGIKVSLYVQINYTSIYKILKFCKYSPLFEIAVEIFGHQNILKKK